MLTQRVAPIVIGKAKAIRHHEFHDELSSILSKYATSQNGGTPLRVGLAVSGGVDSMALAYFCSSLRKLLPVQHGQTPRDIRFQAFVVDHGARKGSREEALKVSTELESRNMPTRVLTIKWPKGVVLSELSNFESVARKLRYQALGEACRSLNIKQLLTAHHADDQAETVLMRILDGHRGRGLGGMKDDSAIPDCYGVYGVYCSGGSPRKKFTSNQRVAALQNHSDVEGFSEKWSKTMALRRKEEPDWSSERSGIQWPMKLEYGGLRIIRPLRHFVKDRLIQTCQKFDVPWFEDTTNGDPCITTRNTIRYIFKNHCLPRAFRPKQLHDIASRERAYSRLLDGLNIKIKSFVTRKLEPRVGTLIIQFATKIFVEGNLEATDTSELKSLGKSPAHSLQMLSLLVIRDVAESVSPKNRLSLKSFLNASKILFPRLHSQADKDSSPLDVDAFTVAGVKFQRRAPTILSESLKREGIMQEYHEWLVTREPYSSVVSRLPNVGIPSTTTSSDQKPSFYLFDGRYWIKLENFSLNALYIRPFQKTDMCAFRSNLDQEMRNEFKRLLKTLAPDHIRYTIPAIVDGTGKVLALPSLNIKIPGAMDMMRYEIRYKEVPKLIRMEYEKSYEGVGGHG